MKARNVGCRPRNGRAWQPRTFTPLRGTQISFHLAISFQTGLKMWTGLQAYINHLLGTGHAQQHYQPPDACKTWRKDSYRRWQSILRASRRHGSPMFRWAAWLYFRFGVQILTSIYLHCQFSPRTVLSTNSDSGGHCQSLWQAMTALYHHVTPHNMHSRYRHLINLSAVFNMYCSVCRLYNWRFTSISSLQCRPHSITHSHTSVTLGNSTLHSYRPISWKAMSVTRTYSTQTVKLLFTFCSQVQHNII